MPVTVSIGHLHDRAHLVVRSWDAWMADAHGFDRRPCANRPLVDLLPEIERGVCCAVLENVLTTGPWKCSRRRCTTILFPVRRRTRPRFSIKCNST